jgi:hypothetical protein
MQQAQEWAAFILPLFPTVRSNPCFGAPPFRSKCSVDSSRLTIPRELAASVAQHDVLTSNVDAREATIHNFSDNTPTIFWQRKGAVSNSGPNAQLLLLQALHQRKHRYVPAYDYLPGTANLMADD